MAKQKQKPQPPKKAADLKVKHYADNPPAKDMAQYIKDHYKPAMGQFRLPGTNIIVNPATLATSHGAVLEGEKVSRQNMPYYERLDFVYWWIIGKVEKVAQTQRKVP